MNKSIADGNNPKNSLITLTVGDSRRIKTASNFISGLPTVFCKEAIISQKIRSPVHFFVKIVSTIEKVGNVINLWTQDLNWMCMRGSEDAEDIFWIS